MNGCLMLENFSATEVIRAYDKGFSSVEVKVPFGLYLKKNLQIKEITYKKALELSENLILPLDPEAIFMADKLSVEIYLKGENDNKKTVIKGYVSHL